MIAAALPAAMAVITQAPQGTPATPRTSRLLGLIAHGPPSDLAKLTGLALAAGWKAVHADGPQGDELMMIAQNLSNQDRILAFDRSVEGGGFPAVRFEWMLIPVDAQPQPQSGPQPPSTPRPSI